MENQIYNKPMYKCGICGEIYNSIPERMYCEQECLKHQEEEAKKAAEAKKKEEKSKRKAELNAAIEHATDLLNKYIDDYGSYEFICDMADNVEDKYFWPNKLLQKWLF